jgi:hypothetical protein
MIITTEPNDYPDADLAEAASQQAQAATALRKLATALDAIPRLYAEIGRLRAWLTRTLADLHNLIAAARATLSAQADGESDPLYYLRDELDAQGQLPPEQRGRP